MSDVDVSNVASGEFHKDRWSRVFLIFAIVCLIAAGVLAGIALTRNTGLWDPLGDYPTQHVLNPHVRLTQTATVNVIARKCAKHDGVMVRGEKFWIAVTSPGTRIGEASGASSIRDKSCGPDRHTDHFTYHNPIPSSVQAIVCARTNTLWRISGTDTPFDTSGRQGVPRTWTTDIFQLQGGDQCGR